MMGPYVALTLARSALIVVGDLSTLCEAYRHWHAFEETASSAISVFPGTSLAR
jgi:hypothetical protein